MVVPPAAVGQEGKVLFTFPPGGQDLDVTENIVNGRWRDEALKRDGRRRRPLRGPLLPDKSAKYVPELLLAVAKDYPPEGGKFDLGGVSNGGLSVQGRTQLSGTVPLTVVFPATARRRRRSKPVEVEDIGVAMFVGGEDTGWRQARAHREDAKDLGDTVELHVVEGEGHIISSLTGADLFDAIERVRA
jgi:hypothetical protein